MSKRKKKTKKKVLAKRRNQQVFRGCRFVLSFCSFPRYSRRKKRKKYKQTMRESHLRNEKPASSASSAPRSDAFPADLFFSFTTFFFLFSFFEYHSRQVNDSGRPRLALHPSVLSSTLDRQQTKSPHPAYPLRTTASRGNKENVTKKREDAEGRGERNGNKLQVRICREPVCRRRG